MPAFTRVIIASVLISLGGTAFAGEYEVSTIHSAHDLLTTEILESRIYTVEADVHNDGFLNRYTVSSRWGEWQVDSDALLKIRLVEIEAMEQMRLIEIDHSFEDAITDDAGDVVEGVNAVIDDPGKAFKGAGSGVKKLFSLAGESWNSRHTRKDESALASLGNTVSGFNKAKREYAGRFGVDPYSSNTHLHSELDRIARAASGGYMVGMVAKALIPGGVGMVLSATNLSHSLNELVTTRSELELRIINREKLQKMGIDAVLIERFLDDAATSPTVKTYVAGALEALDGVSGRDKYLQYAIGPPSEDVAIFRAQSAMMYAGYHAQVRKLERFDTSAGVAAAIDGDNTLVLEVALDHLLWTEHAASVLDALDQQVAEPGDIQRKVLGLPGTTSELALAELQKRNWEIKPETLPE